MSHSTQDRWTQWLLHRRFGGNQQQLKQSRVWFLSDTPVDLRNGLAGKDDTAAAKRCGIGATRGYHWCAVGSETRESA